MHFDLNSLAVNFRKCKKQNRSTQSSGTGQPPKVLGAFNQKFTNGVPPNNTGVSDFNRVLEAITTAGRFADARQVFDACVELTDLPSCNILLRGYAQSGRYNDAKTLFDGMPDRGISPDETTYNAVLDAAVRAKRFPEAWDLLNVMMNMNVIVDKFTVSILVKTVSVKARRPQMHRVQFLRRLVIIRTHFLRRRFHFKFFMFSF